LEEFPPKRLLSLTDWQLEERRILLEKYLHSGAWWLTGIGGRGRRERRREGWRQGS